MATANHYLLDVVAGIGVALVALGTVSWAGARVDAHRKRAIVSP
jgi:hypothetical protein